MRDDSRDARGVRACTAFLAALVTLVCPAVAAALDAGYRGHELTETSLVIVVDGGRMTLTPYNDGAMAVHVERDGMRQLPSFAIARDPGGTQTAFEETARTLVYGTDTLRAVIDKHPVRIAWYRGDEPLLEEERGFFAFDTLRGFRFRLAPGEKLLGGGQRVLGMDRRGHRLPMYQKPHYGYETESSQMYFGLPAVVSSRKYLLLFDNTATGAIDLGQSDADVLQFEAVGGRTAYLVTTGASYPEVIANYVDVTGRQPLPPRWALGNYASRFGYRTEAQTRDTVQRFIDGGYPLDAVVLDLFWFGPDIKGHVGNLDWDRRAFPDPVGMMADFDALGVKTILITEPFVLTTSSRWDEAVASGVLAKNPGGGPKRFDFYFGNTGLIDVFDPAARAWFWNIYEVLTRQGVGGWWGDLGEPEVHPTDAIHAAGAADEIHNAYGHEWARLVFEGMETTWPDRRPVVMMRSGFAGSQRYGIIPWTGDVSRTWGGLKPQVELALQMGLLGLAWTHSDLGGFAGGESFDAELYTRWLQYGVFQPVYRPHAQEHIPAEPVFHDEATQDIVREFIRLRYRLLPYLYTLAYENSTTGMPLMRPLFFEDEADPTWIDEAGAYLWGDAFLVSPIVSPGVHAQSVRLPAGAWFDFWTGARYDGAQRVEIPVTPETIPVLVRAGAFVPMIEDIRTTRDYSSARLTVHYYADGSSTSSSATMYEDDGATHRANERGLYELLAFRADRRDDRLAIGLKRSGGDYEGRPAARDLSLVVHNWNDDAPTVRVGDYELPVAKLPAGAQPPDSGAWYDDGTDRLTVRFHWTHEPVVVSVD